MEEYLHKGVWFQPLYERGVWGNEVSPQRNTAVRGFEPLISKVTISRLNQLSHTTWEAIASTLSVGIFLGNETHQTSSKGVTPLLKEVTRQLQERGVWRRLRLHLVSPPCASTT